MSERPDPTLDRIRQVRHEISAEFDHDPYKLVEYYMRLQERHADRLLRPAATVQPDKSAA